MHSIKIPSKNGEISARIYGSSSQYGILIIAGAMGTKQTYYAGFAEYISTRHIITITFDYTGIGSSLTTHVSKIKSDMKHWGSNDLETVLQYVYNTYESSGIFILGHSAGGQLIGMAPSSLKAAKIILVAAQTGYWKFWEGFSKYKMWANWYIVFPLLVKMFGYMPSKKLTGMENLPAGVALQWRKWCISPNYLFDDLPTNELHFEQIKCPVCSFSCTDDIFAPKAAVDWLAATYKNAKVERLHLDPVQLQRNKIGHFGFFKPESKKDIWEIIYSQLSNETGAILKVTTPANAH